MAPVLLLLLREALAFTPQSPDHNRVVSCNKKCAYDMHKQHKPLTHHYPITAHWPHRSLPHHCTLTSSIDHDPLLIPIPYGVYTRAELPTIFAYPHNYKPHPIATYAAKILREQLCESEEFSSMVNNTNIVGKMTGVLVVQYNDVDSNSQLGYLQAHSGGTLDISITGDFGFCPPVYNRFEQDNFYAAGEAELNELNREIEQLENDPELAKRRDYLTSVQELQSSNTKWSNVKQNAKAKQNKRKALREEQRQRPHLSDEQYATLDERLKQEGAVIQRAMKKLKTQIKQEILNAENALNECPQTNQLQSLKDIRKQKSRELQDKLFNQYNFLNIRNETQSLLPIFVNTTIQRPPSGAGDCAAPKLFQYAFTKGYIPICMAEFWWGTSPANEVRRHGLYYPACRGKCQPILQHMMNGMNVEENPMDEQVDMANQPLSELDILYEDKFMLVVNKLEGIMSTPGKNLEYSMYSIIKERYPDATGPLLVHRLDMSTSGILLVAKDKDTHKALAAQFIDRTIQKQYIGKRLY